MGLFSLFLGMASPEIRPISIKIDKITNSIENVVTGESFATSIIRLIEESSSQVKKSMWVFDWKKEINTAEREVYKLVTVENPDVLHGLISIEDKGDHIFMHLIESAKNNKGKGKVYYGVATNLIAFACKRAFEAGYDGFVSFYSKTKLMEHYKKTLGARSYGGIQMAIETLDSIRLVRQYFKDFQL